MEIYKYKLSVHFFFSVSCYRCSAFDWISDSSVKREANVYSYSIMAVKAKSKHLIVNCEYNKNNDNNKREV